jgi:beta-galactosidase
MLQPTGAEPLAAYTAKFYAGTPAITRNQVGYGTVYYIGIMGNQQLINDLLRMTATHCGLSPSHLPEGVFRTRRSNREAAFTFYMNATKETKRITLTERGYDVLEERYVLGDVQLKGYEVLIIRT